MYHPFKIWGILFYYVVIITHNLKKIKNKLKNVLTKTHFCVSINVSITKQSYQNHCAGRKEVSFMKQKVNRLFNSEKVLLALCACMYIVGCIIEAGF